MLEFPSIETPTTTVNFASLSYEEKRALVADLETRSKVAETYFEKALKAFDTAKRGRNGRLTVD